MNSGGGKGNSDLGDKPTWVKDDNDFISWMQNLEKAFKSKRFVPTVDQMEVIVQQALQRNIQIEFNLAHSDPIWNIPHLHFGKSRVHVPLPQDFPTGKYPGIP